MIMNAIHIALKDLKLFFQDRGALVQLFVLPMVFIIIFTGLFTASQGKATGDSKLGLVVVNLDEGGVYSQEFIDGLNSSGGLVVRPYSLSQAQDAYASMMITRYLTIPEGFSQAVAEMQPVKVELTVLDAQGLTEISLNMVIDGVARDISMQAYLIESLRQFALMQADTPEEFRQYTPERLEEQARSQFQSSKTSPLVVVKLDLPSSLRKPKDQLNVVQIMVPGFTVLFVFMAAQITARSFYDEKKIGSFRRLLAAPVSKPALLVGKLLPNFIIVLIQVVVIFSVSIFVLPFFGMPQFSLGNDILGLILTVIIVAICSTSLGIVIASLAHTEGQIGGISSLILWVMGFLGGAIIPVSMVDNIIFNTLGNLVPHKWAIDALQDLLVRGYGLTEILPGLGILLCFSVVFFTFGLWRFEYR
jgi:ABC-2 type transport system permease protein